MTVTTTYLPDLSRVRIAFSSAPTGSDYATVERSTDGITWTTVRGGSAVTLVSGAGNLDDYEFVPGVVNTYRVTYVDAATPTFIGSSGPFTGNNASLSVAYNGSTATNDLILLIATIRNTAASPNTPSGWTLIGTGGSNNVKLFAKYQDGAAAPTVTFTGGAAGDDTTAQCTTFRNLDINKLTSTSQVNSSAQNVAFPSVAVASAPAVVVLFGWKQDDWTSISIPGFDGELWNTSTTTGNDAAHFGEYKIRATDTSTFPAGTLTVTGGAAAISRTGMVVFPKRAYLTRETQTITPSITQVWVKNPARPYMNTPITTPVGELVIEREARAGVFQIVGRSKAIAVTDQRGGQQFTLGARVEAAAERDRLDEVLTAGETIFLHIPVGTIRLKSMYAVVGKTSYVDEELILWMPLTEVAAPASTIVGDTVLWSDIISTYATWADLIAAKATWGDVLDSIGDPSDIITG